MPIKWSLFSTTRAAKVLAGMLIVLALACGGWFFYRQTAREAGGFLCVAAQASSLTAAVSASGTIEPVQSLNLSFKNPGTVKLVAVEQGQEVKEGQLLLAQDDGEWQTRVNSARANLDSARARLEELQNGSRPEEIEQARAEEAGARVAKDTALAQLERVKALHAQEAAAQKELDDAQNNYAAALARWEQAQSKLKLLAAGSRPEQIRQAKAAVQAAEAQLALAESDLQAAQLRAPFPGIVAEVNVTVGQRVTGVTVSGADNSARPLISLVSKKLRVRAQVNEADIGQVAVGQKAYFTVNAFGERKFSAVVAAVAPRAITVSNVQLFEVLLDIEEDFAGLKAGMPCDVEIVKELRENVLVVPRQALSFARSYAAAQGLRMPAGAQSGPAQNRGAVLVFQEGRVELRPVQLGISSGDLVEITAGLAPGEQVAVGQKNVRAGGSPAAGAGQGQARPLFLTGPGSGGGRR